MNHITRLPLRIASREAGPWICSSCTKFARPNTRSPFFNASTGRAISNATKPRRNAAPTMEQMRAPHAQKNASTLYYTLSIILGTVAFSYGSVPFYKMVRPKDLYYVCN